MSIKSRQQLKDTFVAGAYPDQQDYHDALDSYLHKDDLIQADQLAHLHEQIAQEAREAATQAVEPCHCQPCQPQVIVISGAAFAVGGISTATEMETYEKQDILQEAATNGLLSQDSEETETSETAENSDTTATPQSTITFVGPADLTDRLIGIFCDGTLLQQTPAKQIQQL